MWKWLGSMFSTVDIPHKENRWFTKNAGSKIEKGLLYEYIYYVNIKPTVPQSTCVVKEGWDHTLNNCVIVDTLLLRVSFFLAEMVIIWFYIIK